MRKIISHIKNHKKCYLSGIIIVLLTLGIGLFLSWDFIQFNRSCKEKDVCACAQQRLTKQEKRVFVALASYMKKTGSSELDAGILKYATPEELTEVGLKMKSCSADVARQKMLDNNAASRSGFPGDYNCMRQTIMNELSNEEVLFLQSPQSKSLAALQNPQIQNIYLVSSAKLMKCMNEQIQRQYLQEVEKIKGSSAPASAPKKEKKKAN